MNRWVEFLLALGGGLILLPVAAIVALAVRSTSRGPTLYWSERIGRGGKVYHMPKFRSMKVGTAAVASHLLADPKTVLTPIGGFLRRTSLDEIPQLWCVLRGEMSLVGPRPALFNQLDLIAMRRDAGVDVMRPGITGWAQINGRDEIPLDVKVALDRQYLVRRSLAFDLHIILRTIGKLVGDNSVSH